MAAKTAQVVKRSSRFPTRAAPWNPPSRVGITGSGLYASLMYNELDIKLTPGAAGTTAPYVFIVNGLYDPNITGAGHQPTGFDQLIALYERYTVLKCRYRIAIRNTSTTLPALHGISTTDQVASVTDARAYVESGATQWKLAGVQGSGSEISYFSGEIDVAKAQALLWKDMIAEDSYSGSVSANPADGYYLHIWVQSEGAVTNIPVQAVSVELEFTAFFKGNVIAGLS